MTWLALVVLLAGQIPTLVPYGPTVTNATVLWWDVRPISGDTTITGFDFLVDGTDTVDVGLPASPVVKGEGVTSYSTAVSALGLSNGPHTLAISSYDADGASSVVSSSIRVVKS